MKLGKRLVSLALALVMVLSLTVGASAATTQNIKVQLSPNITVKLNGEAQTMADVNGNPVYPVLNGGTTYLPVRAVSGMLGIGVDWDGATQTVLLDTTKKTTPTKTDGKAAADANPTEITVQLSPGITVKLDGKAQTMTDVNGNPVYPLLYNGTTYLPIRAVSNMLGVSVDWDGATQTVLLGKSSTSGTSSKATFTISNPSIESIRALMNMVGYPDDVIEAAVAEFEAKGPNGKNADGQPTFTYTSSDTNISVPTTNDGPSISQTTYTSSDNPTVEQIRKEMRRNQYPDDAIEAAVAEFEAKGPNGKDANGQPTFTYTFTTDTFRTSEDAKVLGEKHVACDYAEVDWSTADDGYVRVKLTKQVSKAVVCNVWGFSFGGTVIDFVLKLDQWVKIPLGGEGNAFQLTVTPLYSKAERNSNKFQENYREDFEVRVTANLKDPDAWTLLSHVRVDFESAPKTVAKAAELTKNCKTDAEKITAIFEYIAKTIKYDQKLYDAEQKREDSGENSRVVDLDRDYSLDNILDSKTGVCEHYAVLMAGMLRSQGIPCKVVCGDVYTRGNWEGHAWVSVSPDTKGLNMSRLGAGHDEDGWIRLDPTWGNNAADRAAAAIDKNHQTHYAY